MERLAGNECGGRAPREQRERAKNEAKERGVSASSRQTQRATCNIFEKIF